MKSGGSSSGPTSNPQPQNSQVTPYGNATAANPYWTSYLPSDPMVSAQLGDPSTQRFADNTEATPELIAAQAAVPIPGAAGPSSSSGSNMSSSERKFLAELMLRADRDKYLSRVNKESAGGGSAASGSFSGSGFGGGGASGGLY